jgi:hypothetical protein
VRTVARLQLADIDPSEMVRRTGHSSVSFTYDRYGHLFPEIDKQAAQKLEGVQWSGASTPCSADHLDHQENWPDQSTWP